MHQCRFEDLMWNKQLLRIGALNKSYPLHQISVTSAIDDPSDEEQGQSAIFYITYSRTEEKLFRVVVSAEDIGSMKSFQNAVLMSRLSAR